MEEDNQPDLLYNLLEKSKCVQYYDQFNQHGLGLDDVVILEKEDLASVIDKPLLLSVFWRNLINYKEEQKQKEIESSAFQIDASIDNTRKRKAKGVLLEERLSNKNHIVLKNVTLTNLPKNKPTDSDYKKITEQLLVYLKRTNIVKLRHGQIDGLCGYLIAKYPILDENKYSGYELLKSKIINVLRNYRSNEKKKLKTDNPVSNNGEPQYILCIQQS